MEQSAAGAGRPLLKKLEDSIVPGVLLAAAVPLWWVGAQLITEWLLARNAFAQGLIITVLAEMGWSGVTILIGLGVIYALMSLVEMLLWPRRRPWRALRRRLGAVAGVVAAALWLAVALLDLFALYRGVEPLYFGLLTSQGLPAPLWGLPLAGLAAGLIFGLLPELIVVWALPALFRAWIDRSQESGVRSQELW